MHTSFSNSYILQKGIEILLRDILQEYIKLRGLDTTNQRKQEKGSEEKKEEIL